MPSAPRSQSKATKIAYDILGKPQNLQKKTKEQKRINELLNREETQRVR